MPFLADLHLHSHFSRATSGNCRPGPLAAAAARKGLTVIGTGDFTHAGWRAELREGLAETAEGLYRLRDAAGPEGEVRFLVTGEISCIYKQDGKTRKIHHLILLPDLAAAETVSKRLEARGANLRADGRPILGLDSRTLLAVLLDAAPDAVLIPAHIWTPHFSLFGANSGFDVLEECFGDLSGEITAYETGLSSDPPMNWRLSALNRLTLVSNSDAHSPDKLGREAVEFETEPSYPGLVQALRGRGGAVLGTVEFFPEEGKYHYDGHRNCGVCWHPRETRAAGGLCRVCGRPVTVGVLNRVCQLADRPEGFRRETAPGFETLVPLGEVVAAALDTGPASTRVREACRRLTEALGPEIPLLRRAELAEIAAVAGPLAAEALRRVRAGEVEFRPGYDGEYGALTILRPEERRRLAGQAALFALPGVDLALARRNKAEGLLGAGGEMAAAVSPASIEAWSPTDPLGGLNEPQRQAAAATPGPVIVLAGPGTGKTRTLVQRILFLLGEGAAPETITAITFTHRAAEEMRQRLGSAAGESARGIFVGTFHRFCLELLTGARGATPVVLDEREAAAVLAEAAPGPGRRGGGSGPASQISLLKSQGILPGNPLVPAACAETYRLYQERLAALGACDYDDLLLLALDALKSGASVDPFRGRAGHLLVDEFQDVNAVQYELVKALAGDGAGLFVIGDPDQAIYGFRGADHRFFGRLQRDFPRSGVFRLTRNYRSSGNIVRAARAILGIAPGDAPQSTGQRLRYLATAAPRAEAKAVVREIERLVGGTGMQAADAQSGRRLARAFSLGEIAVLFRTGRQASPLEEALLSVGIPYRVLGQRALLAAPDVQEALDILRYLDRPTGLRFQMALRGSRFDPGKAALALLGEAMEAGQIPPSEAAAPAAVIALLSKGQCSIGAHERIQAFLDFLAELRAAAAGVHAAEMLLLRAAPPSADGPSRALRQVARAAAGRSFSEFLLRLTFGQEGDHERREDLGRSGEGVSLLTMHAAKGLEFPAVFLVGLSDEVVPWHGSEGEEELAEERRLLYVAMTRAAEALILCGPPAGGDRKPSRFLAGLPAELVEEVGARRSKPKAVQRGLFQ